MASYQNIPISNLLFGTVLQNAWLHKLSLPKGHVADNQHQGPIIGFSQP